MVHSHSRSQFYPSFILILSHSQWFIPIPDPSFIPVLFSFPPIPNGSFLFPIPVLSQFYSHSLPFPMVHSHSRSQFYPSFILIPSHSHWLFPFPPAPLHQLLVVSHQITNDH